MKTQPITDDEKTALAWLVNQLSSDHRAKFLDFAAIAKFLGDPTAVGGALLAMLPQRALLLQLVPAEELEVVGRVAGRLILRSTAVMDALAIDAPASA